MQRRNLLATALSSLMISVNGCLDSFSGTEYNGNTADGDDDGLRNSKQLALVNFTDEEVSTNVTATADGEVIVLDTFELKKGFVSKNIADVPEGTKELTIEVEAEVIDIYEKSASFDVPKEYQIEKFHIMIRNETINIDATSISQPD